MTGWCHYLTSKRKNNAKVTFHQTLEKLTSSYSNYTQPSLITTGRLNNYLEYKGYNQVKTENITEDLEQVFDMHVTKHVIHMYY